ALWVSAAARQPAAVDDQIFLPDRSSVEEAFEDLARARRVARLRGEGGAGRVRGHALVRHRAPRVVLGCRLGEPHVAGIAGELPALARLCDRVAVADLAARRVDPVGAALPLGDQLLVE